MSTETNRLIARLALVAYVAGIPFAFGYMWNRSDERLRMLAPECIIFASLVWPVMAVGKLAIEVTKEAAK